MEPADRVIALLEEIRDMQRTWMERTLQKQDEALQRQASFGTLYRRVLVVGAVVMTGLLGYLVYSSSRR